MTLLERLEAIGYRRHDAGNGTHYELGSSASLRVICGLDGMARVIAFDCQMTHLWTVDFSPDVDDALIIPFVEAAEKEVLR